MILVEEHWTRVDTEDDDDIDEFIEDEERREIFPSVCGIFDGPLKP